MWPGRDRNNEKTLAGEFCILLKIRFQTAVLKFKFSWLCKI